MGTSASTPSTQVPQSTSADAPQPIVAETQTKRKASTDAKAQQKRQKSAPASASTPISQPPDVIEQVDPPAQNIPSAIIPQGPTTDEVVEDIPSASPADLLHDPLQTAPSSQAQEIALKQVNRLTIWFIITTSILK
jgi:hypothetical protein